MPKKVAITSSYFHQPGGTVYVLLKIGHTQYRIKGVPEIVPENNSLPVITLLPPGSRPHRRGIVFAPETEQEFKDAAYSLVMEEKEFFTVFRPEWVLPAFHWKMGDEPEYTPL